MLSTLAIVALLDRSATVDYQTTGAPVTAVVRALAEATSTRLVADEALDADVLVVRISGADEDDALRWVAEAIGAEWRREGDGLRLTRTHAKELEQERAEDAAILAQVRRGIEGLAVPPPIDRQAAEQIAETYRPLLNDPNASVQLPHSLASRTPIQRLATRIGKDLDLSKFMDLPVRLRVYVPFSESAVDRSLPRSILSHLRDYRREDETYALALTQRGLDLTATSQHMAMAAPWHEGAFMGAVSLMRYPDGFEIGIVLRWGEKGHYAKATLMWPDTQVPTLPAPVSRAEWNVPLDLPPLCMQYAALKPVTWQLASGAPTVVSRELTEYVMEDESFDLFGLLTGHVLVKAAELSETNLVACLPDESAVTAHGAAHRAGASVQSVMNTILSPLYATVATNEDVILCKPVRPAAARRERLPRQVLRSVVRDSLRGVSALSVLAEYAEKSVTTGYLRDPREDIATVTRMLHFKSYDNTQNLVMRLYGRLSEAQRGDAGRNGLFLSWDAMSQEEQTVWRYVMMSKGGVGFPGAMPTELSPATPQNIARSDAFHRGVNSPSGPEGLMVRRSQSRALIGATSSEGQSPMQIVAETVMPALFAAKEIGSPLYKMDLFGVLPFTEINVYVVIDGREYPLSRYGESYAKEGLTLADYESLPKDFVEFHRAAIEQAKKWIGGG